MEPMTQQEVDALPSGSFVEVVWSGGNGPHVYEIGKHYGQTVVVFRGNDGVVYRQEFLDFVGPEKPFTVVRRHERLGKAICEECRKMEVGDEVSEHYGEGEW